MRPIHLLCLCILGWASAAPSYSLQDGRHQEMLRAIEKLPARHQAILAASKQFFDHLPAEYRVAAAELFSGLTVEDAMDVAPVFRQIDENSTDEMFLEAVKAKSPRFHAKLIAIHDDMTSRIERLEPEAKGFVTSTLKSMDKMMRKSISSKTLANQNDLLAEAMAISLEYYLLSEKAIASLENEFAPLYQFIRDERVMDLARKATASMMMQ